MNDSRGHTFRPVERRRIRTLVERVLHRQRRPDRVIARRKMGKPKIKYMGNGVWACITPFRGVSFGRTPVKAYAKWLFSA